MNLGKINIYKLIKTEKSESELVDSLKNFDCKKVELENKKILISGKAFYDFYCDINIPNVKLTAKPKKNVLVLVLIFFIIWTVVITNGTGILFGPLAVILFVVFGVFVHKKMMKIFLEELSKLLEN